MVKKVAERSYLVKTSQGHLLRRNRKFLRSTREIPHDTTRHMSLPTSPWRSEDVQQSDRNETQTTEPELPKEAQATQTQREETMPPEETPELTGTELDMPKIDTAETPVKSTRAGRVVKPPQRYKDFVRN